MVDFLTFAYHPGQGQIGTLGSGGPDEPPSAEISRDITTLGDDGAFRLFSLAAKQGQTK